MYAPRYAPNEIQATADDAERRQMDQGDARYGFRPLALPALAAAARPRPAAAKATVRLGDRKGILGIVHEDEPLD